MPRKRSVKEVEQAIDKVVEEQSLSALAELKAVVSHSENITKVSWKGKPGDFKELTIWYQTQIEGGLTQNCDLPAYETPHEDFFIALNRLMKTVITSVYLDDDKWRDGWVSGVTIKPGGIVITAQLELESGRAIVNTPFIKNEDLDLFYILAISDQCQFYIHGKREEKAQLSLFDEEAAA